MKKILCSGLLSLSLGLALPLHADDKADMEKLQKDIAELQKELKKVEGARSNVQQDLQKSETQMSELQKKVERIQQEIQQQNQQLGDLNKNRTDLEKARAKQQAQAAEQVKAAYQLGQQPQFKVFLNQESPERISRMMKYHSYFMAAHADKMKNYVETINQLNELEPEISRKTIELNQIRESLFKEQTELAKMQEQRKQTLVKINTTISNKDKALQDKLEDQRQLQNLLAKVSRASTSLAAAPSYVPLPNAGEKFSARKGRLPWPTAGKITHGFGTAQTEGQLQWNGVMISANAGQQVRAVHYGRVVFADYFRGQGLLVIVDHGEGYLSLYAHNQHLNKKAGDPVTAGEIIASVGDTGGQADSGLYFEIRFQGRAIDPMLWLARS